MYKDEKLRGLGLHEYAVLIRKFIIIVMNLHVSEGFKHISKEFV